MNKPTFIRIIGVCIFIFVFFILPGKAKAYTCSTNVQERYCSWLWGIGTCSNLGSGTNVNCTTASTPTCGNDTSGTTNNYSKNCINSGTSSCTVNEGWTTCSCSACCPVNGTWSACSSCDRTCSATCGGTCGVKPTCTTPGTWSLYGSCSGASGWCVKSRTCTPGACGGTCSGLNWDYCTAANAGCSSNPSCSTTCDYPGGNVPNGTVNNDCSCGTKWCPEQPACCTPTDPGAPTLNSPLQTTPPVQVRVGTVTNLSWTGNGWGTGCPSNTNNFQVCVMSGATCDLVNYASVGTNTSYNWTPAVADTVVSWKIRASNGSNTAESVTRTVCVESAVPVVSAWSGWSAVCGVGTRTRTCSETCGTDDCTAYFANPANCPVVGACSVVGNTQTETRCAHCAPTLGAWSTCDINHKRTQTCTESDGLCDGDDCDALGAVGGIITEDCTGTITGTLFDASDLSFCPADIGTNPTYASIRFSNETFGITGTWPVISAPVATDVDGNYSESVFVPGTYSYDYTDLYNSGAASEVKFECQSPTATVMAHGQTVVKDTGFWRVYGGWWQVQGGSVYAGGGVRSDIPGLVDPASNQVLILDSSPALGSRTGVLSYGSIWDGTELGTNPNAKVSSRLWRVQSLYDGLRFDYNYFNTRMNIFDSTAWDGDVVDYTGDGAGYQIFKHTGDVTLNYGGPTGTQKVILLIDGNVNINNLVVPNGAFLAVIAKGNITFGSAVTSVQGWFVAESIKVPSGGGVDVQFKGQGSFVGWTMIELKRDMGVTNNTQPAEIFTYRPDLFVNAPVPMKIYSKAFSPFIP